MGYQKNNYMKMERPTQEISRKESGDKSNYSYTQTYNKNGIVYNNKYRSSSDSLSSFETSHTHGMVVSPRNQDYMYFSQYQNREMTSVASKNPKNNTTKVTTTTITTTVTKVTTTRTTKNNYK